MMIIDAIACIDGIWGQGFKQSKSCALELFVYGAGVWHGLEDNFHEF
jgi:hypothetical protein